MPDYSKGKIYRLVCNITGKQYIGSTCHTLAQRKAKHVWTAKHDESKFVRSKEIIDGGDFSVILVENFPCNNVEELKQRERYFIETMECVNKAVPLQTKKEYYEKNIERLKQYREDHKEHYKQLNKEWCSNNRERINERRREYYNETLRFQYNESKTCECGKNYTQQHKKRHEKSRFHQDYLKSLT